MSSEGLSVERLLALYPDHAAAAASTCWKRRGEYKRGACARLGRGIRPRHEPGCFAKSRPDPPPEPNQSGRPGDWPLRLHLWCSVVLATTTAFAQTAMPGHALYGWKLGSEIVWRTVSADQVSVDLSLAERRTDEITTVVRRSREPWQGTRRIPRGPGSARSRKGSAECRTDRQCPGSAPTEACRRRASRTASWTNWCTAKATRSPDRSSHSDIAVPDSTHEPGRRHNAVRPGSLCQLRAHRKRQRKEARCPNW